jgi:hypothetical protein
MLCIGDESTATDAAMRGEAIESASGSMASMRLTQR